MSNTKESDVTKTDMECLVKQCMNTNSCAECQLRMTRIEDELFLVQLQLSSSRDSGIPTGRTNALNGGAIYDDSRRIIVSVARAYNQGRDVFVTHLAEKSTEVMKDKIPFVVRRKRPIYDGKQFVYFLESPDDKEKGRRFGRLNLDNFVFEELSPVPAEPFGRYSLATSGCFHQGVVFAADSRRQLCGYNVETKTWNEYHGIILPTGEGEWGAIFSDTQHLYFGSGTEETRSLYRIDLDSRSLNRLSFVPTNPGAYNAFLIYNRPGADFFVYIVCLPNGTWYMYSSKTETWKPLSPWNGWSGGCAIDDFLVYAPSTKTIYYHINGHETWEMVQL